MGLKQNLERLTGDDAVNLANVWGMVFQAKE